MRLLHTKAKILWINNCLTLGTVFPFSYNIVRYLICLIQNVQLFGGYECFCYGRTISTPGEAFCFVLYIRQQLIIVITYWRRATIFFHSSYNYLKSCCCRSVDRWSEKKRGNTFSFLRTVFLKMPIRESKMPARVKSLTRVKEVSVFGSCFLLKITHSIYVFRNYDGQFAASFYIFVPEKCFLIKIFEQIEILYLF